MESSINERLISTWNQLEDETEGIALSAKRKYKRLEIGKETGIRLSCRLPDRFWELLIEVGLEKGRERISFPDWKGMSFESINLDLPIPNTQHICLRLEHQEHKDVFLSICSDLVLELQAIKLANERKGALIAFLDKWTVFFERHGVQGLSAERQRGLFGELWWLRRLINKDIIPPIAIHAWKGCDRGYHDFEIGGKVVEVKTTLSKEPRKVVINNERQLDNRGLISLHLLALSLIQAEDGGESLPEMIASIRLELIKDKASSRLFECCLHNAGYLDNHAHLYSAKYTVRIEELFLVDETFPKITEVPPGLGDIKYSLFLAACKPYVTDTDDYISELGR